MKVIIEYIWLGGNNELRSKTRVLDHTGVIASEEGENRLEVASETTKTEFINVPHWNYDGSSTGQATGEDSEVILVPVAIYPDPFIGETYTYLAFCETRRPDGTPLENNHRPWAKAIFDKHEEQEPWYGIEQEYFITNLKTGLPVAFPNHHNVTLPPQGQYYCSVC